MEADFCCPYYQFMINDHKLVNQLTFCQVTFLNICNVSTVLWLKSGPPDLVFTLNSRCFTVWEKTEGAISRPWNCNLWRSCFSMWTFQDGMSSWSLMPYGRCGSFWKWSDTTRQKKNHWVDLQGLNYYALQSNCNLNLHEQII